MCKFVNNTKHSRIDKCIRNLVENMEVLIDKRFKLKACCCGHGIYPLSIVIELPSGMIVEMVSSKIIPRKRNFYKKDKKGFYYIPECVIEVKEE